MQSVDSPLNKSRNQNHAIASDSYAGAHVPAHPPEHDSGSVGAFNPAFHYSQSHGQHDQRRTISWMLEDQLTHINGTSAANPDYLSQQNPSLQQQETDQGQAVRDVENNSDIQGYSSIPLFHDALRVGKSKRPIQRRRYQRSRGSRKKVHCTQCPDFFWSRSNRDRHLLKCHPPRKLDFPCVKCSASYGTRSGRTVHMRRAHPDKLSAIPRGQAKVRKVNGRIRFFCYYAGCEKSYTGLCNLYRHVEMAHLKKRYRCECGYEATTRFNLKMHRTRKSHC